MSDSNEEMVFNYGDTPEEVIRQQLEEAAIEDHVGELFGVYGGLLADGDNLELSIDKMMIMLDSLKENSLYRDPEDGTVRVNNRAARDMRIEILAALAITEEVRYEIKL